MSNEIRLASASRVVLSKVLFLRSKHMRFSFSLMALCLLTMTGCGGGPDDLPEIGQVTGVVTVDGSPKGNLIVSFQPEGGRPAMGTTDAEGRYELTYSRDEMGTKIGKNLVTISSEEAAEDYEDGEDNAQQGDETAATSDPIPAKYNTMAVENPDMTVDVSAGANEFNWDVKTDGGE